MQFAGLRRREVRGIPVLVLIFFVYYGLPVFGIDLDNFWAAVAALSAFMTAHVIEIVRGAIQSIHHGQTEAGKAIGLTFWQRMVYVIFPQAMPEGQVERRLELRR